MEKSFIKKIYQAHQQAKPFLDKQRIEIFVDEVFRFLFQLEKKHYHSISDIQIRLNEIKEDLCDILFEVMEDKPKTIAIVDEFARALPDIYDASIEDAK